MKYFPGEHTQVVPFHLDSGGQEITRSPSVVVVLVVLDVLGMFEFSGRFKTQAQNVCEKVWPEGH